MPSETAVEGAGFPLGDAARRHLAAPSTADGSVGLSRETLVDRARDAVLALIDDEHLGAGDALPSAGTLAERFGVSKAVVREALSALAALGIVEISNGRAARVRPPDSSIVRFYLSRAIRDTPGDGFLVLMDLRAPLEVRAASLAADRLAADPAGREQLEELLARMGEALGDAEEYPRLDLELHALIARLSGNLALQGVLDAVSGPLFRAMRELRVTREQRGLVGAEHDEHSAVVTAILAGDAAAAAAAMDAHMTAAAGFAVRR
ncbi:FadR/GntR family transcriptional regulator [Brachybacterium squillarum]|uniref:FadR/GntR family transcriptional regulator n=1 Tax=Brachybacterium squillarum TaxID=661979 RepID=UPI0022231FF2|nr:FCD domain-containing protein [Brachybacterium squillarum]MCW1806115.1 FCD domain-containing protein [Brachybacterium squillarum]